jgi:hypothetical protein
MAGKNTKPIISDYNTIQKNIAAVLGSGGTNPATDIADNTFGYGLSVLSSQVSAYAKISTSRWSNLRTDILKSRQHQTGATEVLTVPTQDVTIAETDRAAYSAMADLVVANRLVMPPSGQATKTSTQHVRSTAWNNDLYVYFTATFAAAADPMYFFNTGGYFDVIASRAGGTVGLKNTSWTTMLTNMGTLRFNRYNTTRIDTGGTTTVVSSIGWTSLSSSPQLIYQKLTEAPTYSPNKFEIYVQAGGGPSTQIIFTLLYYDASGNLNPPTDMDQNVDGTLTSTFGIYRATGVNVSVLAPSVAATMAGGALAPVYSLSPNVTSVNEAASVVFTVSTSNVTDNTTLYWSTSGSTAAADFTDSSTTGTVVIVSNTGTITRTLSGEHVTEGSETFSLSLRTGSTAGPIVANSTASVTVNDTSIETYQVTAPASVDEGSNAVFTVTTQGVPNGTTLYWVNVGDTSAADFTDSAMSGSFTINSNSGSITRTLTNDTTSDPGESIQLQIRTASTSGPLKVTSSSVTVNDTSVEEYYITENVSSVGEGGSVTFTVSTVGIPNGTTLYWNTSGSVTAADFTSGTLSGTVVNTGTITRTLSNDGVEEGAESFTLNLRTGSTAGPIKATSGTVNVRANGSLSTTSTTQWTAPTGITQIQFSVTGGRGGNGGSDVVAGHVGFNGSTVTGTATVVPGTTYNLIVGAIGGNGANGTGSGGGAGAAAGVAGYAGGNGGAAGSYYKSNSGGGGGGGAPSWIRSTGGTVLVVAGGGGGGGGAGKQGGAGSQIGGTSGSGTGGQGGTGGFDGGGGGGGGGGYPLGGAGGPITAQDYTGRSGANGQSTGGSVAAPGSNATANIAISW